MSGLKKEGASGVTVYNLSAGKTLPEWLREKKKTALRYDEEYKKRIELIQHLEFPVASQTVRMTGAAACPCCFSSPSAACLCPAS